MEVLPMKYTVNNDRDLYLAVRDADDGDAITVCPGEYFNFDKTVILSIKKNIAIIGQDSDSTLLNCGFLIANKNFLILKNLSVNYDDEKGNAVALYDGGEFYGKNIVLSNSAANEWNTIYCQNSSISLTNSEIINANKDNVPAIMMENSYMYALNSSIYFPALLSSECLLEDSFISYSLCLRNNSSLMFNNITIDSTNNTDFSDFYIDNESSVEGTNITFIKNHPSIDILDSQFESAEFLSGLEKINWRIDDQSTVWADGQQLSNTDE